MVDFRFLWNKYMRRLEKRIEDRVPERDTAAAEQAARNSRGELFVDIGAYHGRYSLIASERFRKVLAFEPSADHFNQLLKNLSDRRNVTFLQAVVADKIGKVPVYKFKNPFLTSGIGYSLISPIRMSFDWGEETFTIIETLVVSSTTVDQIVKTHGRISFLKIDVDGGEWKVLEGAKESLGKSIDRILVEIHNTERKQELIDLLATAGYSVTWIEPIHAFGQTQ